MGKTVRFAVLGVGVPNQNLGGHDLYNGIGEVHGHFIGQTPGAQLVACCDVNEAHGQAYAARFGCDFEHDYERLLARDDIDAVSICTPSGLHGAHAIAAAQAGKHVVVEKPLEITTARVDAILTAVRAAGTRGVIVYPKRYAKALNAVRDALAGGRFGKLAMLNAQCLRYRDDVYYHGWRGTWAMDGGGACMNQGIHMVDALLYLRPDVETVQARWGTLGHSSEVCEVEDTAAALLTFSDGALGLIQCTTCSYPDHGERLEVHAMGGTAVLTDTGLVSWEMAEAGFAASAADLAERDEAFTGHRSLYEEVVPYFRGQAECRCDLASGRRAVALIEAIYESARADGAPVRPTLDG